MEKYIEKGIEIQHKDCFAMMKSLEDNSVDVIMTDPPYGVLDDEIEENFSQNRVEDFAKECFRIIKKDEYKKRDGSVGHKVKGLVVFFNQTPSSFHWNEVFMRYFRFRYEIIWVKNLRPLGDVKKRHENAYIYGDGKLNSNVKIDYLDYVKNESLWKGHEKVLASMSSMLNGMRKMIKNREWDKLEKVQKGERMYSKVANKSGVYESQESDLKDEDRHCATARQLLFGPSLTSVLSYPQENSSGTKAKIKHPTVKPVALLEKLMELCAKEGGLICDPFLGSGTTALAAKKTGRRLIGCEALERYFEIAVERLKRT